MYEYNNLCIIHVYLNISLCVKVMQLSFTLDNKKQEMLNALVFWQGCTRLTILILKLMQGISCFSRLHLLRISNDVKSDSKHLIRYFEPSLITLNH